VRSADFAEPDKSSKSLISLALPRGLEPLFSPLEGVVRQHLPTSLGFQAKWVEHAIKSATYMQPKANAISWQQILL
jgi:hypothetical protein